MKYLLCIIIWMVSLMSNAQIIQDIFCDFVTDGTGESKGLKIKIKFPCDWDATPGDRPGVIKSFSFKITDSVYSYITLNIIKEKEITSKYKDNALKPEEIKKSFQQAGEFISYRMTKIDMLDCAEVVFRAKVETPLGEIMMDNLGYLFFYKDFQIFLTYTVGAVDSNIAKKYFEKSNLIFKLLATKTVVISQWE